MGCSGAIRERRVRNVAARGGVRGRAPLADMEHRLPSPVTGSRGAGPGSAAGRVTRSGHRPGGSPRPAHPSGTTGRQRTGTAVRLTAMATIGPVTSPARPGIARRHRTIGVITGSRGTRRQGLAVSLRPGRGRQLGTGRRLRLHGAVIVAGARPIRCSSRRAPRPSTARACRMVSPNRPVRCRLRRRPRGLHQWPLLGQTTRPPRCQSCCPPVTVCPRHLRRPRPTSGHAGRSSRSYGPQTQLLIRSRTCT